MPKLVSTLGTSPGGVLETFEYLMKNGVQITEIRVITTKNPEVEKAWRILNVLFLCCVKQKYPKVEIAKYQIDIDDINNEDDLRKFKEFIEGHLQPDDYMDITGGRKGMSVAAALAAKAVGAKIITSIISQQSYRSINDKIRNLTNIPELKRREECNEQLEKDYCELISKDAKTIVFDI
ncbi:hypothetical protein BFU36_08320 [Sulfolobus sp. A20]|uniref:CRISPR-associated ring nuclease Crn1 n=1 Tax=Sulfolobaceae TaxID=118883 RepID=UPI000845D73D|nr:MULTISPECIES: CRISPR-associated ring nuclease Crn1 [unclassified Sulfolobus]TRM77859.1 hypothetical protein DJ532_02925 [Sulfolobus sp. A20-N-F8]TRM79124.1 hypothetical protein DJ528_02600 [Sulfolobus sp. B5]TRM82735.1 hypothetical protein DJ531_08600 [Sulfolobus sp. A20-N-F6]TRM89576.1 hypothetical protein DJ529_01595 [Sulfolobus sp. C3]TRM93385.1 hypothetical protein DJ526_04100 [Sulfolobus sp. A20-N-G8]TRM97500.1 hypothetical protein DJ527_11915 [Sulfolobus sp. F1]TRN01370.1 hypothetic